MDPAAAKQFLIAKILQEAELSQVQLSDVERKMLYFTEQHPTLPDILQVNAQFESEYDADEYEEKIVKLLKSARSRDLSQSPEYKEMWDDAVSALKQEDHYILVM